MSRPPWPPRDWRALLALIATVAGASSLTALGAWIVWILWQGAWPERTAPLRIAILGRGLFMALGGGIIALLTLGFAINRRSIRADRNGFEMSGGDDDSQQGTRP